MRILSIQYLRGVAALMVVWHHALHQITAYQPLLPHSKAGANGVDLFFVISGFIMVLTTLNQPVGAWEFLKRRILRIVPMYWLTLSMVVLVALAAPKYMKSTVLTWDHVLLSYLFIPHDSPSHPGHAWPLLVPGWTLNFEMFFYALFAAALWLGRSRAVWIVGVTLLVVVLAGSWFSAPRSPTVFTYTSPMLLQFASGGVIAWAFVGKRINLPIGISLTMVAAGFAMLVADRESPLKLLETTAASMVVLGALHPGLLSAVQPLLKAIGDASYSIYLTHILTLGVLRSMWMRLPGTQPTELAAWMFMGASICVCALVGWLVYRLVESPLLAWMTKRWGQRAVAASGLRH